MASRRVRSTPRLHPLLFLLLLLLLVLGPSLAVVNLPGVEFNAAAGQRAHASSYYDYRPNAVRDVGFVPQNAIDGFTDESSWWSSGDENATASGRVFWQINMSSTPPKLKRLLVRWHGFLTPASYKVRVSYAGENFLTIAVVANQSIDYDRVDVVTAGLDKVDTRFKYLRLVMDTPNVCQDMYACGIDGSTAAIGRTNERVVYGIREVELWATGTKNGARARTSSSSWLGRRMMMIVVTAYGMAESVVV